MDLLRVGAQARKTGWRPRADVAKDKYNMDDIDDFFNDTEARDEKPRKTLGVRRRSPQQDDTRADKGRGKKSYEHPEPLRGPSEGKRKVPKEQGREAYAFEILDDELHDNMTLSPIPLLSLQKPTADFSDLDREHLDTDRFDEIDPAQFDDPMDGAVEEVATARSDSAGVEHGVEPSAKTQFEHDATVDNQPDIEPDMEPDVEPDMEPDMEPTRLDLFEPPLHLEDDTRYGDTGLDQVSTPPKAPLARKTRPRVDHSDSEPEPELYSDDDLDSDFHEPSQSQAYSTQASQSQNYSSQSQKSRELIMQPSPLPSPPPEGLRRSKRTKIAPLAYWRNERIVYSRANDTSGDPDSTLISDIRKVPLQQIYEVVHIPEPLKQKPPARRGRPPKTDKGVPRGRKPKPKPETYDYESDPEIEGSEWFKLKLLETEVFLTEDTRAERVVAWAPDGGDFQPPPPPSKGLRLVENFKVAPLFDANSDMIAAGLLEFPVEGFKSLRTAGDSLFIFHVAKGLVEVTLNTDKFVVTRGCSFEIPKLNIYSLKNIGQTTARLFFVQCQLGEK